VDLLEKLQLHLGLEWVYEEKDVDAIAPSLSPEGFSKSRVVGRINDQKKNSLHSGLCSATLTDLTLQTSLVAPPPEEIATLLDLAMRGDLRGIVKQAARLEALDRQWVPFATHLRQLAKGFKGKQILEFLKQY
jgi:hypothetical protein